MATGNRCSFADTCHAKGTTSFRAENPPPPPPPRGCTSHWKREWRLRSRWGERRGCLVHRGKGGGRAEDRDGGIMRVLPESGARQNYNLGDVIPLRRNGLHIPRRQGWLNVGGERGRWRSHRWEGGGLRTGERRWERFINSSFRTN